MQQQHVVWTELAVTKVWRSYHQYPNRCVCTSSSSLPWTPHRRLSHTHMPHSHVAEMLFSGQLFILSGTQCCPTSSKTLPTILFWAISRPERIPAMKLTGDSCVAVVTGRGRECVKSNLADGDEHCPEKGSLHCERAEKQIWKPASASRLCGFLRILDLYLFITLFSSVFPYFLYSPCITPFL